MRRTIALVVALAFVIAGCSKKREVPPPSGPRPVIFIGLDGADWQLLDGYMRDGTMPVLAALSSSGLTGDLKTLHPPLSPLVWTSMMTGVSPLEHRILDFTRFNPATRMREPITSDEREVPAVWNMATSAGKRVAVFGLWATWPAEQVAGTLVSDRLFLVQQQEKEPPPGIVYPPDRQAWAREALAKAEASVGLDEMRRYLPWLDAPALEASSGKGLGDPVAGLRRILVETRLYETLGADAARAQKPDLSIVYFQGTDAIGHLFAPFAPPRQDGIAEADYEKYSAVPKLYFADVDRMLGRFKAIAEERGAILVIASDHGFLWSEGRPRGITSAFAATAGKWHREDGIYLIWDPARPVAQARRGSGEAPSICATLLQLSGIAPAEGIAAPLADAARFAPASIAAPVNYRRDFRRARIGATQTTDPAATGALADLRALGYLAGSEKDRAPAGSTSTRTAGSWNNEGLLLEQGGKLDGASAAFEESIKADPESPTGYLNLSRLLRASDASRSDAMLLEAVRRHLPDGPEQVIGRAIDYQKGGSAAAARSLLERASPMMPDNSDLLVLRARLALEGGDCRGARELAIRGARLAPANAIAPALAGAASLCLGDSAEARRQFQRSLEIDPDQPELRRRLAVQ